MKRNLDDLLLGNLELQRAQTFAQNAHEGQVRKSGEPYFTHCEAVTRILYEEWGLEDEDLLSAGYIHDTMEDCDIKIEELHIQFGEKVAFLVEMP